MFGEHHHPLKEFPQFAECIHELKLGNPEFAGLHQEYEAVDQEIYRIEEGIETPSDDDTEGRKLRRVWLKDRLVEMLNEAG